MSGIVSKQLMFYLSEIIGKKILDLHGNRVARVRDLVAEVLRTETSGNQTRVVYQPSVDGKEQDETVEHDAPVIKGLVARTSGKLSPFFVPIEQISELRPGIIQLRSSRVDLKP